METVTETTTESETGTPVHRGTVRLFDKSQPLILECGRTLAPVDVAYETYGRLNAEKSNAVLLIHALTGNARAATYGETASEPSGWWNGAIGRGRALDPDRYFLISANLLGSCYGSTGPASIDPDSGRIYGTAFPPVTTRDMARVLKALLEHLGIPRLGAVIGGSLGGMLTWQMAVDYPELMRHVVPIAGSVAASAWVIALNEVARQAIFLDSDWKNARAAAHEQMAPDGLKLARMIAMISYRSEVSFEQRFGRQRLFNEHDRPFNPQNRFQVENYLHYQGEKLLRRFDPFTYLTLTRAMDWHDVSRGYGSLDAALQRIRARVDVIGIDTDRLFPAAEMRQTVERLHQLGRAARYHEIQSPHGHDAFLIEFDQLNALLTSILEANDESVEIRRHIGGEQRGY